jgi:hypothetical protein
MKRNNLKGVVTVFILHFLLLNNVIAQSHVWFFIDVPNPQPTHGSNFTTEVKVAAWKGIPGATDLTISFDPKELGITKISIPSSSPFFSNNIIDSLSKSGEIHIACFKNSDGISWDKVQTIGKITWKVINGSNSTTDIGLKIKDQVLADWNSVDVEAFGQHIELFPLSIESIPKENNLGYNYPNPFSSYTTIDYQLAKDAEVSLVIYDIRGKLITTLVEQEQPQGHYKVEWNGNDRFGNSSESGLYVCKIVAGDFSKSFKMLMLK